jgi:asparagine synthase (glutamine-hydrolysing)
MCGIFGVVGNISHEKFEYCLSKLEHRGPDGFGIWYEDGINLGHRRLSIIDLTENGKQPMLFEDKYAITFNGEIYNYLEIKSELQVLGYRFKSASDTEVVLAAFDKWGEKCFTKFNGMWALAIWNKQSRELFLSRDRMGKKPLFYTNTSYGFAFASEMKALYPLLDSIEKNTPIIQLAIQDVFSYETTEHCLIKGIKRFPAASHGQFKNDNLLLHKYWTVFDDKTPQFKKYEEQVEYLRYLFLDACKIRMRSDVQIGTALSGGLDSTATITAMSMVAKQQNKQELLFKHDWQHAYVATFPGSEIDESIYAKRVVDYLGIGATYLSIDPLINIDKIFHYTYMFEELYLTSPIPFIQLYNQVKANGTTVTLDGHGSDELFAGYPFQFTKALNDALPNPIKMHQIIQTYRDTLLKKNSYLYDAGTNTYNALISMVKNTKVHGNLDYLNNLLYQSTFETILPTLLRNYDRYSMINGVEIRMPFLDYRIVNFAFSIPWSSKVRNGYSKAIVRDAIKPFAPEDIVYRKAKIGFNSPFTEWIKGPLKTWINDEIHSVDFNNAELINKVEVQRKIHSVQQNPNASFMDGENAWKAIMPYIWEKSLKNIHG